MEGFLQKVRFSVLVTFRTNHIEKKIPFVKKKTKKQPRTRGQFSG